jgi:hypothetical protein
MSREPREHEQLSIVQEIGGQEDLIFSSRPRDQMPDEADLALSRSRAKITGP